jgi:predicted nucleotidyltransferase
MNPKEHLKTILKVQSGSRMYNLDTETSDDDYRGCVLCTDPAVLFGFQVFEQLTSEKPDMVLWNLPKFINLALKGNSVAFEVISAPDNCIVESTSFGEFLRQNRDRFYSKMAHPVLKGYFHKELKRATGVTTGKLGEFRKMQIEEYGYSLKNASHCIRLLLTGIHLFKYNEYKTYWDGSDRNLLMSFKKGESSVKEFKMCYSYYYDKFNDAFEQTKLKDVPDRKFILDNTIAYMKEEMQYSA